MKTGFFSGFFVSSHFPDRTPNVPLRRAIFHFRLRKSVKSRQASFLEKGCDEMKTDKCTEFIHD